MFHKDKNRSIHLLIWFLFCFMELNANYIQLSVSSSLAQINVPSTYSVYIDRRNDPVNFNYVSKPSSVPLGSTIVLNFPPQYLTLSTNNTVSCINAINSQPLTCVVDNLNSIITITDYYSNSNNLAAATITITIYNINNAATSGITSGFSCIIYNPQKVIIDQSPAIINGAANTPLTFNPGTFKTSLISANNAYVLSYSVLTFTLTPTNIIPASGSIVVGIPLTWSSDPLSASTLIATPSCIAISNITGTLTCSLAQSSTQQIITISGMMSTLTSSFTFTIGNILTPSYEGDTSSISIYSQTSTGKQIDTCLTSIKDIKTAPFQLISMTSQDTSTVQNAFTAKLQITISRAFYYLDTIEITVPSQFANCQISSVNLQSFTQTANLNLITLSNFPSQPSTIASNNIITLIFSNIVNPISVAPIKFYVNFLRDNGLYQSGSVSYSATSTTLTTFSISTSSNLVRANGAASISLSSNLSFPTGGIIVITYPSSISATNIPKTNVSSLLLNGVMVTGSTYSVQNNQIIFQNIFNSAFSGLIQISINQFDNPRTTQPSSYNILVTDANNYNIMTGSYSLSANVQTLVSNSISTSSTKVLAFGVIYTATIQARYQCNSISIIIPNDIIVESAYQSTCSPNSCALNGNNLTFSGSFTSGSYSVNWGGNKNPNSLQPTSSFQIFTYLNGWGVEVSQGLMTIVMTDSTVFNSFILYPSSYMNSESISTNIALSLPNSSPSGTITITFPSSLDLTHATCSGCTVVPPNVLFSAVNTSTLSFVVASVKNIGSFKPIDSFSITLKNINNYLSLYSTANGWTNTILSTFTTIVTSKEGYKGETTNFQFQISALSGAQQYAILTIDNSFIPLSTAPTGTTLVTSHQLRFNLNAITSTTLNINLTAPIYSGNYVFKITTYTSDNYQVGSSTSNSWTFDCATTECRSCQSDGSCQTCYNSSISNYYILNTNSSTCERACSPGYYLILTTCYLCSSNCLECVNSSSNCTRCYSNYYLDLTYNKCVTTCQPGYFASTFSLTCSNCDSTCQNCFSSAKNCTSCALNYYFLSNNCLIICPINNYINNAATRNCDTCTNNCLTCINFTYVCLSCNNTKGYYLQENTCRTNCSSNYFLENNFCVTCQAPCKLCSTSSTSCSACYSNSSQPINYKTYCIAAADCPLGYYINITNGSCNACPSICQQCTSLTSCSSCSNNYYLYNNFCIPSCPNTTYTAIDKCLACINCLTCSSQSVCTSCIASQYLYLGMCYSNCPSITYISGTNCMICNANCPTCLNSTNCLTCVTNMNLYNGICYQVCPVSTYPNTTKQLCYDCPASCATCTSSTICQTCKSGYSMESSMCVLVCSIGVSSNQICYPCGIHCPYCQNTTCNRCDTNYYLYNNSCLSACPNNMLSLDTVTCTLCTNKFINCSTCNFNVCLSCIYGELKNGMCVPCSPGFYEQSASCITCPSKCMTCLSLTNCLSCTSNNYLRNGTCQSSCPINMVPNGTICSLCVSSCSICNLTNSLCSVCNAGIYLYQNLCVQQCPSPLIVSFDSLSCVTQTEYYKQYISAAKIVPFPFSIAALLLCFFGAIFKWFNKNMHLQTTLCGLICFLQQLAWIIFFLFQFLNYINYHSSALYSFILVIAAMLILILLNFIHLRFYYKYVRNDQQFIRWQKKSACANCVILVFSTMFNFKFYRFIHSKFLEREQLSMTLSSSNRLLPFSLLGIISIFLCSTPTIVGCGLAIYFSIAQDQQFFVALDTLVITGIMILLILLDLYHPPDYFISEHETKNFKKKMYEQDQEKIGQIDKQTPLVQGFSKQNLMLQEDQGQMAMPPTSTNKFASTFQNSANKQIYKNNENELLEQQSKISNISESQQYGSEKKLKWVEKQYDKHGYLIKYDNDDNPIKYDEYGYRVQIDKDGVHHKYNQDGNEVIIRNGKHIVYDKDGFILKNGKRYDERGYEVRQSNGILQYYDQNGYRVQGFGENQKKFDQEGNLVVLKNGKITKYQKDGYEIVEENGQIRYRNNEGLYVRKNQNNQWQIYDPEDGFILRKDEQTGKYIKYDKHGNRIQYDKYGNLIRYDEDGNRVTVLPGNLIVRYDKDGYRIQKDKEGKIHRYDQDGYEVIIDQNGNTKTIDKHGYIVEKNMYGSVTLYDENGYIVIIDEQTGKHRRYNDQGLEVITDIYGQQTLWDKRGRRVVNIDDETYEKYDTEGNKIWLDENGYENEENQNGQIIQYDKIGDVVEDNIQIDQDQNDKFESIVFNPNMKKLKYKYKKPAQINHEQQLSKLTMQNNIFNLDEQSEVSDFKQFHDYEEPIEHQQIQNELDYLIKNERNNIHMEESKMNLQDLKEIDNLQYQNLNQKTFREGIQNDNRQNIDNFHTLPEEKIGQNVDIKSVADISVKQRSFDNEGVQPLDSKTDQDQLDSIDQLDLPLGQKKKRGGRSEMSLNSNKKQTQTVYNFNTVEVEIKNQNNLYDQDQQIESLHQQQWEEQENPMIFTKVRDNTSNTRTNILYIQEDENAKDTLSQFVNKSQQKNPKQRYKRQNDMLSGKIQSIEEFEEQLFNQLDEPGIRERKQFKLSGAPNPLVQYAKTIEAHKKSLQQKMYLESYHK